MMTPDAIRAHLAKVAQDSADEIDIPVNFLVKGARIVVIVTDQEGAFVGVGSNTTPDDTRNIIRCAHDGDDLRVHGKPCSELS